ncbi:MAG: glycosyl hydrolase [Gracilimonas sp.]|uniref:WD40/YVTN/BNR-like repeat-containing protein n=1 Tax=Gracilimonas sp. TaxID=1974203 RepID=UPI003753E161|nr:glycosyl hydrolase [Gracilimonas sp.]
MTGIKISSKIILGTFKFAAAIIIGSLCLEVQAQQIAQPGQYDQLKYRHIGPDGNRTIAVIGVPGDPSTILVGAASGGIWKTTDYGTNWKPVFESQSASSVSALGVSQSAPNEMWAGTGETFLIRPAHAMGDGIYKSTDYGDNWQKMGLDKTGRIGQVRVNPQDSDIVYACALGHSFGPQKERGVYRTIDGGENWELVLHVNEDTGCADMDIDPNDPNTVFAAFWQLQIDTWKLNSGGPHSGVYRSKDGGDTWEKLSGVGKGLPGSEDHHVGKVSVRVAPSNSQRVYVLTEESSPGFYKSDDGGDNWELVTRNHTINERAPYYTRFDVDPEDQERIYFASVRFSMSRNGGKTLVDNAPRGGGDNHDIWIDPTNPKRFMVAHDGGLGVTLNHGRTFDQHTLPIAQMYHVHVDNEIPYNVYGNRQDGYSYKAPSNSRMGYIPLGLWEAVGGCESGFSIPDTVDGYTVWSGCYDGGLEIYDERNKHSRNVRVWPEAAYGWAPKDLKFRWHWTFPIYISPHDNNKVYVGSQYVHVTNNRGRSWDVISPDLTQNLESHQESSGGVATDNLMTFDGNTLFAIAESELENGLIWTGSNDGLIHLTRDGGENWINVSDNISDFPEWGTIANIEPSKYDAGTAYISVDAHQQADFDPYIYKTENYGRSWEKISAGIPKSVHSYVHVVREDPKKPGVLYAGTDNQVYFSPNDGEDWLSLRNNMPSAPVYWLTVQDHFDDLVIGTYGRGFWIMDDINPIRNLTTDVMNDNLHLFALRPAYRFYSIQGIKTDGRSHIRGENPPYGASINYFVKNDASELAKIEIFDRNGDLVRTLSGNAENGINRVWWDLSHEPSITPKLRVAPPNMPWVPIRQEGWRPLVTWDLDLWRGQLGPRVIPGIFTVKVTVGEHEMTRELEVRKDPTSVGTVEEIEQQVAFGIELRDQLNEVVVLINEIEWIRKEFEDLMERLKETRDETQVAAIINKASELNDRVTMIESNLYDIHLTGAREDAFRNPMKLYGRISALGSDIMYNGADFAPTQQQVEVFDKIQDQFEMTKEAYNTFVEERLIPFYQEIGRGQGEVEFIEQ